jgi:hypothetical protein
VHGAGVIEDKLLADKRSDSWSRVVETKVTRACWLLQKHVDPDALKFFTVFSSVAGRYGNSGQSDYATANELMNRLCQSLQARWGQRRASARCAGAPGAPPSSAPAWSPRDRGQVCRKGRAPGQSAALGRRLFREELARAPGRRSRWSAAPAPWESREAEHGCLRMSHPPNADAPSARCWAAAAARAADRRAHRAGAARSGAHLYLQEHALDGKMVLPAAAALELMAEAAQSLWPGWRVVEVREHIA